MKNILCAFLSLIAVVCSAQVGIGTTTPHASAALELKSTNKGFLPPRMTQAQRNTISSPETGLVIYNTSTNCINIYVNNVWNELCGILPSASIGSLNCAEVTNNGSLKIGVAASGVSSIITYNCGNGKNYNGQTLSSSGVTGLTATLSSGTLTNGTGTLTYIITGTPSNAGMASFSINIGGQSCSISRNITSEPTYCNSSSPTPTTLSPVTSTTGKIWMDRNLGSNRMAIGVNDSLSYGSLFQWGRAADGHQCIHRYTGDGVTTSATGSTLATTAIPNSNNPLWDGLFIINNNDWLSTPDNNLWQGTDGINNPCPGGYRMPAFAELDAERTSWGTPNAAGAFASPLKWSLAGWRNNGGLLQGEGVRGQYWSSTISSGSNSMYLFFTSSTDGVNSLSRSNGSAVRCIKN